MSFKLMAGGAMAHPDYGPGFSAPPLEGWRVTKVTRAIAERAVYAGAMYWDEDNGSMAVFKDHTTGMCYAQPVKE